MRCGHAHPLSLSRILCRLHRSLSSLVVLPRLLTAAASDDLSSSLGRDVTDFGRAILPLFDLTVGAGAAERGRLRAFEVSSAFFLACSLYKDGKPLSPLLYIYAWPVASCTCLSHQTRRAPGQW